MGDAAVCVWRIGALPERLVVDREGCLHAGGGRPTEEFASFCGQLSVGWRILDPGDCQAKGVSERLQGFMETSFESGRSFANELDFQNQLDRWFSERANVRLHRTLRERPVDRLERERERMRPLLEPGPDLDRRIVIRVPPQPYVHVDRNDYSLDPRLVGRRVEVRVSQREVIAVALDTASSPLSTGGCSPPARRSPMPPTSRRSSSCAWSAIAASPRPARTCSYAIWRSTTGWPRDGPAGRARAPVPRFEGAGGR